MVTLRARFQQWTSAAGYLAILLPPALLLAELFWRIPFLTIGSVLFFMPLTRLLFGEKGDAPPAWNEAAATCLHYLPVAYALALLGTLLGAGWLLQLHPLPSPLFAVGFGLALWAVLMFATCPAHELIHRRCAWQARVGRWVGGAAGYPILSSEHATHHAKCGDTEGAQWPRADESAWRFTMRRVPIVIGDALARERAARTRHHRHRRGLLEPATATCATWLLFTAAGGSRASLAYAGAALGVWLAMQLLTYLQHWGLGQDNVPGAGQDHDAWEDRCRFQGWITLNISLHQAHHRAGDTPYYRLAPSSTAPTAPAGYVVLLFLCLAPACWAALMRPQLQRWQSQGAVTRPSGRRLSCFR
jgi:hypothetical protein